MESTTTPPRRCGKAWIPPVEVLSMNDACYFIEGVRDALVMWGFGAASGRGR
jgi:hypothetical protein